MTVEAKIGLIHHRVLVDGVELRVQNERGGWHRIEGTRQASRVRYSGWSDRLWVEGPEGPLEVRFHWRGTRFAWRGRVYHVRASLWNRVLLVEEGGRVAASGRTTWSGVRLQHVAPDLESIAPALALGLALRSMTYAYVATAVH